MINEKRIVETFLEMVKIDSESGNEKELGEFLLKKFAALGWQSEFDEKCQWQTGHYGNLIFRTKGNIQNVGSILFAAHMDTVVSNKGVNPIITEGVIRTDGRTILGADDKAGIAALLEAATVLAEDKLEHGPIEVVLTVEEETGLWGAKYLDYSKLTSKYGFVLDNGGPVNTVVVKAPAEHVFTAKIHGKAAHAGVNPEDGINAIHVAAIAISQLDIGRIDDDTTINIGSIHGGEKTNVVPDLVELSGEVRSFAQAKLDEQIEKIQGVFRKASEAKGAKVDIQWREDFPGFSLEGDEYPVKLAQMALKKIGKEPKLISRGGGSDTNIFNAKGICAVNLGVAAKDDHTTQESVAIKDLISTTCIILAIIDGVKQGFSGQR